MSRSTLKHYALIAAIALAYFVAGKIGLSLAFVHANVTAVWPPTGIALAALLLLGDRVWPGILIGALFVNLTTAGSFATSLGIAFGNTLEGVIGAWLVRRFARGPRAFEHPYDIFKYALVVGLIAAPVSSTIGLTSLSLGGFAPWSRYTDIWLTWWLGDIGGALVVAPFLIIWGSGVRFAWSRRRWLEAPLLLIALIAVGLYVFAGFSPAANKAYALEFLCFPPLMWAAFRFSQREVTVAMIVLSEIATWGTVRGMGPFAGTAPNESLLLLQAFMAVVSVTVLGVAAAVAQRNLSEAGIRQLNHELEERVRRRTEQLTTTNQDLLDQMIERERAQQELTASEARLREAQRVAGIGSWEWDVAENRVWWSDELYTLYGLDRESFGASYESFLSRVHPEDRERVNRAIESALREAGPFSIDHRVLRDDGEILTLHAEGRVLTDASGKPVRMAGTGQDITTAKRAEEERARLAREQSARREAEEANRLKDEFLATLSHELRTPLNAIVGWAHLLREGRMDPAMTERAVETINRNAQIQAHLISDMLDISRMVSGKIELRSLEVDLAALIRSAVDTMTPAAGARRITLHANLDATPRRVIGDPDRLQQVICNLLSNAIKFGAESGRIEVALTARDGFAEVGVTDDGAGIDPEFLPHVFERFRQRDSSSTRRHGGLGLGLAIVRHLVELHGGAVSAANRERGSGAVFTFRLPLAGHVTSPASSRPPLTSTEPPRADGPSEGPLHGVRVLVVEDEADSRELIATLLVRCGAEVEAVGSCREAIARFRSRVPEVLISDIEMPEENGYDLIARIRALPAGEGGLVPAIALTAYAGEQHESRVLSAGYQIHLSKPVDAGALARSVTDLIEKRPREKS